MDVDIVEVLVSTLAFDNLVYAFLGCLLGTAVGVLPGLGPSATMALLLPVTAYIPPLGAIIMFGGIYYGASYGGSTTAILMKIPGEPSSIPAALEGYPLTKQGRGGEALAMAAIVSFLAGTLGALAIAVIGAPLARLALLFGPPEYFALVIFSLFAVATLSEGTLLKRLLMVGCGFLVAAVGVDPLSGTPRLTFGTVELMQGFGLVPLLIGIFGVSEVFLQAESREVFSRPQLKGWLSAIPRGRELAGGLMSGLRGTAIGFSLGLLPGMIPTVTSFISYDVEKRVSKTPEKFGNGAMAGIAGPEAANNATSMAGFIPLMAFGIPTTGSLAILLAALTINGLQPGPALFTDHALFTWTVIASMFVANLMLLLLNLPLAGFWARLSLIPYKILGPAIIAFCVVGAYSDRQSGFDVLVCVSAGIIAFYLRKRNWPLTPFLLAFLLGPMVEASLSQSLELSGGSAAIFFERPYSLAFLVLAIITGVFSLWFKKSNPTENGGN